MFLQSIAFLHSSVIHKSFFFTDQSEREKGKVSEKERVTEDILVSEK